MEVAKLTVAPAVRAQAAKAAGTVQAKAQGTAPKVIENDRYIPARLESSVTAQASKFRLFEPVRTVSQQLTEVPPSTPNTGSKAGKWWEPRTGQASSGGVDTASVSAQTDKVKAAADKVAQTQKLLEADEKAIADAQAAVQKSKGANKEENARLEAALKTAKEHNAQLQKDLAALQTEVANLEAVGTKVQDPALKAKVNDTVKALKASVELGLETSKQADRTLDAGLKVTEALKSPIGGQVKAYQEAKKAEEEGKKLSELYGRQQATQQTSRTAFEGFQAELKNRVQVVTK